MDELVHHCLRELSFDGDLGCDVSRLGDFIRGYYAHAEGARQTVDEAYCAFVWSVLVQQPTVIVGTVPQGARTEVAVAPQPSQKRKAKQRGEADSEPTAATQLNVVADAKLRPLLELKAQFGDSLHVAVDAETTFAAITGSHIRPSKLTPMVYTILQLITRGRENGISTVSLGRKTGYDQKTCHYLISALLDMDLVLKLRQGGASQYFCVHKYFYERSPFWREVREEDGQAASSSKADHVEGKDVASYAGGEPHEASDIHSGHMDARHLASLPIVRARIVKLLMGSTNHMHASQNLILALGFMNPSESDRRFFLTRMKELVAEGLVEIVQVRKIKNRQPIWAKCVRLKSSDADSTLAEKAPEDSGSAEIVGADVDGAFGHPDHEHNVKANSTIHKQIIDLIEESGQTGMTLNEISAALGNFDRRTIELLLTRLEKYPPPAHLADLGIAEVMEHFGRERRHRYYTVATYKTLFPEDDRYDDHDLSHAGEFSVAHSGMFYADESALHTHIDRLRTSSLKASTKPRKNPILPDGTVKKGRPRKDASAPRGTKRKRPEDDVKSSDVVENAALEPPPAKRKRGRPPKPKPPADEGVDEVKVPKKRGRPPKKVAPVDPPAPDKASSPGAEEAALVVQLKPVGRRRGRPRKVTQPVDDLVPPPPDDEVPTVLPPIQPTEPAGHSPYHDLPMEVEEPILTALTADARDDMDGQPSCEASGTALPSMKVPCDGFPPCDPVNIPIDPVLTQMDVDASTLCAAATETLYDKDGQPNATALPPAATIPETKPTRASTRKTGTKGPREKTNISHILRENEFLRLLEEAGGIVTVNVKQFTEAYVALVEKMIAAKEPTSGPAGITPDRRTVENTLSKLESNGKVKTVRTSLMTATGVQRPALVAYLPTLSQEALNTFLADLSRLPFPLTVPVIKKIDDYVAYETNRLPMRPPPALQLLKEQEPGDAQERWRKNKGRAQQLFSYDDSTVRDVLLAEPTTLSQLYGFIVPKSMRARYLHIASIKCFESDSLLTNIVSKDHRIIHLSYYQEDMPVADYCRVVSVHTHSDELRHLVESETGHQLALRDLPRQLHTAMQVARARSQSRILDVMEILRSLKLVTPLQPSQSKSPWITCDPNGSHPTAFDAASLDGWSNQTPTYAPVYWRFNTVAPLHLWALSDESPPFWKDVATSSVDDCAVYWETLREVSLNRVHAQGLVCSEAGSTTGPLQITPGGVACLKRPVSWGANYVLTWHQQQYLQRFVDPATASTPLDNHEDGDSQLRHICSIVSAPVDVVTSFFETTQERQKLELEKARRRRKRGKRAEAQEEQTAEARALLASKAAQAKAQRERDWEQLVHRVHPGPIIDSTAVRLRRIRARFLQSISVSDAEKWEVEVARAIEEADVAQRTLLQASANRTTPRFAFGITSGPPPVAANAPEKPVQLIIAEQGAPIERKQVSKSKKRKRKDAEEGKSEPETHAVRRRFQWTKERDDLALDAAAIIKARCRGIGKRIDWAAVEQAFPALPRNSVRQRVGRLTEAPGADTYVKRLEERWYDLWLQFRGTDMLPDGDLESVTSFPLVTHLEFLRKHVDKNALRVGFVEAQDGLSVALPTSVDGLLQTCEVDEKSSSVPAWDFMWNTVVDEGREKNLLTQAIIADIEDLPSIDESEVESIHIAESALKMVMGTPEGRYNPDAAAALLRGAGEKAVATAQANLLDRGVLSKLVRDPKKPRPGRTLKISDVNQNALGGPVVFETFQDAVAFEESASQEWREWPLVATDGDMAALLQLTSEHKVDFLIDTTAARAARPEIDWNSKKADDDQIETALQLRVRVAENENKVIASDSPSSDMHVDAVDDSTTSEVHEITQDGEEACCDRKPGSSGKIDCESCIQASLKAFLSSLEPGRRIVAEQIIATVTKAGSAGVQKEKLAVDDVHTTEVLLLVDQLVELPVAPVFWAGYSSVVLVASAHARSWTVTVSEDPLTRVTPRRWLDINGERLENVWDAAVRAVLGVIIFRPGISQAELRWRLKAVYDRQEVSQVLKWLVDEERIQARGHLRPGTRAECLDDCEERGTFWFVRDGQTWYQV